MGPDIDQLPLTSFIIPCYNHGRFVDDAVRSCMLQIDAEVEVIVVDDGSDDGATPQACDALADDDVRVIRQPNAGLPAARNAGAKLARGEHLVFLDADDWVEIDFVTRLRGHMELLRELKQADEVSHVYCQERLTDLGNNVVWRVPEWDPILLMVTNLHPVTCLIRRDRFEAVGGFDETMTEGYEDWDLWLRFAERGWRGERWPEPLFNWRRHSHQTMIDDAVARHEALYRRLLENHRDFFDAHALDVAVRANALLRRADAHWIDESGVPIELQYLHAVRDAYHASGAIAMARRLDRLTPGMLKRFVRQVIGRGANTLDHPLSQPPDEKPEA
ncbi:MAG: glycosyltransferase family A protein [Phycisphaerales bacterium]